MGARPAGLEVEDFAGVRHGAVVQPVTQPVHGDGVRLRLRGEAEDVVLVGEHPEFGGGVQRIEELEARWKPSWVPAGPSDKALETFAAFEAVGVSKYYLQWFDISDRAGIAKQVQLASELNR